MRLIIVAFAAIWLALPAFADTTPWMSHKSLEAYAKTHMYGGKAYAVAIECNAKGGKPQLRMTTKAFGGTPPFHKWQWLHVRSNKLNSAISKLRLKSKPELKYRIVHQENYEYRSKSYTCVVIHR
ncbi:MAG: hypothetical protein ACSHXB_02500 [Sulfitobacter sp.]